MTSDSDSLHAKLQQQFAPHAQNYVNSPVHATSYSLSRLLELVHPASGKLALDIATGGGHVALGMVKGGAVTVVTDLLPEMLQAARTHIEANGGTTARHYSLTDGGHIPFADNQFDIVTCRIAPHHFPDVAQFVKECARVVKSGGVVGIVDQIAPLEKPDADYVNAFEKLRDPSHVWEYPQADWEWFYESAGLTITHTEVCQNRLEFGWWVRQQKVPSDRVTRLEVMLRQAPDAVKAWLQPEFQPVGEPGAMYFSLWQLILIGQKS
jgi:ubiquinone/menaquinone biosynthesis C-methylase UbiE